MQIIAASNLWWKNVLTTPSIDSRMVF